MRGILTIAGKEFRASLKDGVFLVIALLFLVMSIASVYIGVTTKNAEIRAYQGIVEAAKAQGGTIPAEPVIYPLAVLHNMIEYIIMIGAVLAVFLGFDTFRSERESGTLRLVLARPILRSQFLMGKLAGAGMVLGLLLLAALVFNMVLFTLATGFVMDAGETLRCIMFFLLAFLYMMGFYTGALYVSIRSRDRSYGFLSLMAVWIIVSFVIPQLADAQKNYAFALSSLSGTAAQGPVDTAVSKAIELFSAAAQFKRIGNDLLQVTAETVAHSAWQTLASNLTALLSLLAPVAALLALSFTAVQKENAV